MIVKPGQYITIAVTSDAPDGPPVNIRYRPPTGETTLIVSLTPEGGTAHTANFKINCEEAK